METTASKRAADEPESGPAPKAARTMDMCPVCLATDYYPLVLVPCGHGCCDDCAPKLKECPLCKVAFTSTAPNIALIQALGMNVKKSETPDVPGFTFQDRAYYISLDTVDSVATLSLVKSKVTDRVTELDFRRFSYCFNGSHEDLHEFHEVRIIEDSVGPTPSKELPTCHPLAVDEEWCLHQNTEYYGHFKPGDRFSILAFPRTANRYFVRILSSDSEFCRTVNATKFVMNA
jgi:hypothetical protein